MGIRLACCGLAFTLSTDSRFGIYINRIAVDRSVRISIGAGRSAVDLTYALVGEMISGNTGSDGARSALANACRGEVCCVAVQALRATVIILIDTGIIKKAFVAGAGTDNAFPILAKFIARTFFVTIATMLWVTFELLLRQTQRFCVGAAVCHACIACVFALSILATGFGGRFFGTDGIAGTAMIEIIAMDVDADFLAIFHAKGFFCILA